MSLKITILGCGASAGVPIIGCECAVCTSDNPKNKRTRVSVLVEKGDTALLIDTSPDLRHQALRHGLKKIDAVLITHDHADHCHGIDDLRSFNFYKQDVIPLFCDVNTMRLLQARFAYVFQPPPPQGWFRAALSPNIIIYNQPVHISDEMTIWPFEQHHGKCSTTGVRIDDFVYSTDVNNFPQNSYQALENIDLWLVDCLRYDPAPTHAHLELTLSWIEQFKPKRALLTHLSHAFDCDQLERQTPPHVSPAYDGMHVIM